MLAILAGVLILLSALGIHSSNLDLFQLGIAALAFHFAWDYYPTRRL
jgi:hypothetical protein